MITGTLINAVAIVVGGTLGSVLGAALPTRFQEIVLQALGLATLLFGIQMATKTTNVLFPLLGLLIGSLVGEWLNIELALDKLGAAFQRRLGGQKESPSTIAQGFVTATLVFCIGPTAILGALNDGLTGDIHLLAIKSVLDGFASFGFAASFGPGVLLATVSVVVYQGAISLGAGGLKVVVFDHLSTHEFNFILGEVSAVGGLMILAVGLRLLDIAHLRVANFLPGLLAAPAVALLYQAVLH